MARPDEWEVVNQSANGFRLMRSIAGAKIAHREALAELVSNHRVALEERDSQRRQVELSLADVRRQLAETERELARCRDEVTRRGNMIEAQSQVIAELRARAGGAT